MYKNFCYSPLGILLFWANVLAALLLVAPVRASMDSCEPLAITPLDLYLLVDLSGSLTGQNWIFSLARTFFLSCQENDKITLIGFNKSPVLLAERLECTRDPNRVDFVLEHSDSSRGKRRVHAELSGDEKELVKALTLLGQGRPFTEFGNLSDFVKEAIRQHSSSEHDQEVILSDLEHRSRAVVLITDGILDPKGQFSTAGKMSPEKAQKWLDEMHSRPPGWLGGLMRPLSQISLRDIGIHSDGNLEVNTSFWVGSKSFCNRPDFCKGSASTSSGDTSSADQVSRELCRLWDIGRQPEDSVAVCPGTLSHEAVLAYLKKARREPRHLRMGDVAVSWPSPAGPLQLHLEIISTYQFLHALEEKDLQVQAEIPPGKNRTGLVDLSFGRREHEISSGRNQVDVTVAVPESLPRDKPGKIQLGVTEHACSHLRFKTLPIERDIPPRVSVRIRLDEDRTKMETIAPSAGMPLHVDNWLPVCLAVKPWLVDQSDNQLRVRFDTNKDCLVIPGRTTEQFEPYRRLTKLELITARPGVSDVELGFIVQPTKQCDCNEGLGNPVYFEINNPNQQTIKLSVIYVSRWPFVGSLLCAIIGAVFIGKVLSNRLSLRIPSHSVFIESIPLIAVGLSLGARLWAFDGLRGGRLALLEFPVLLLVIALVLLCVTLLGPWSWLLKKMIQLMRLLRLYFDDLIDLLGG